MTDASLAIAQRSERHSEPTVLSRQNHSSLGRRETPQVLLGEDGLPAYLFNSAMPCKCGYGSKSPQCNWGDSCRSFAMAVPFVKSQK